MNILNIRAGLASAPRSRRWRSARPRSRLRPPPAAAQGQAARHLPPERARSSVDRQGSGRPAAQPMAECWTPTKVADVQVRPRQINLFGKGSRRSDGLSRPQPTALSSMPPTSASARTCASINEMLHLAMPEANIQVDARSARSCGLTGTVASPDDIAVEAQPLTASKSHVGAALKTAGQPPEDGDPASGHTQGPHRRSEPLPAQADRRQPAQPRPTGGFQFGIGREAGRSMSPPARQIRSPVSAEP